MARGWDYGLLGTFSAARAVGGGIAVEGRLREGAVRILRVVLLASRSIGHPTWWSPVVASDQNEDPGEHGRPLDTQRRRRPAAVGHINAIKEGRHLARFQFGPPTVQGTHSHGSIGRFYGAGREHLGLPLVRRPTGETFT